jgi:hypothetical protein
MNTSQEVRLTIAYIDAVANEDAEFPLLCDLDLIVASPSKQIFRSNRRPDNTEERFSTVERVILDADELELGIYEVHVIVLNPSVAPTTNFSIAAIGGITISNEYFRFESATKCATDCGDGTCDLSTLICSCPNNKVGESCQTNVETNKVSDSRIDVEIPPWGLKWFTFTNEEEVTGLVTFKATTEKLIGGFRVYSVIGGRSDLPRDFDDLYIDALEITGNVMLTSYTDELSLLIKNDSPHTQKFLVEVKSSQVISDSTRVIESEIPVTDESVGLAAGIIVLIVVLGVGVVIGIIIIFICYNRKKKMKEEGWNLAKDSSLSI